MLKIILKDYATMTEYKKYFLILHHSFTFSTMTFILGPKHVRFSKRFCITIDFY